MYEPLDSRSHIVWPRLSSVALHQRSAPISFIARGTGPFLDCGCPSRLLAGFWQRSWLDLSRNRLKLVNERISSSVIEPTKIYRRNTGDQTWHARNQSFICRNESVRVSRSQSLPDPDSATAIFQYQLPDLRCVVRGKSFQCKILETQLGA